MKLSKLVAYRNLLNEYDPGDISHHLGSKLKPLLHMINAHELQFPTEQQNLNNQYLRINQDLDLFEDYIKTLRQSIQAQINEIEPQYLLDSYKLYEEMQQCDTPEYILNRRILLGDNELTYIRTRIHLYSDWHRAGMIIRPGLEEWIDDLVPLDPLYLVDQDHCLLEPAQSRFNENYQRRLRSYKIQEAHEHAMLDQLPDGQFGFCLAYNFFNYKPFEIVRGYLTELYNKLIPGGVLAMTINDCDYHGAVELCERNFMSYLPGSLVCGIATSLGFAVIETKNLDNACSWFEFKKPGEFVSLKGGQALAMILPKPIDSPATSQ